MKAAIEKFKGICVGI